MKLEGRKDFDKEAAQWDANPGRVKLANDVVDAIIKEAAPAKDMDVIELGCGTGLISLGLQRRVGTITCVDSSRGMLDVLDEKIRDKGITNMKTQLADFDRGDRIEGKFHMVVSSMTMHHVKDIPSMFKQWYDLLLPGGFVCAADLDIEDGSFHADNTGVFHYGFDRKALKDLLQKVGFREFRNVTATTMSRDAGLGRKRGFTVFLIMAVK